MNIITRNIIITNRLKNSSKFASHLSIFLSPKQNYCCIFSKFCLHIHNSDSCQADHLHCSLYVSRILIGLKIMTIVHSFILKNKLLSLLGDRFARAT